MSYKHSSLEERYYIEIELREEKSEVFYGLEMVA